MSLVYRSAVASLLVQVLVSAVTFAGFFVRLPDESAADLRVIFGLEFGSQVVEFVYYLFVVCRFRTILTWTRYLDWVVSTPVMLASTALFFRHRRGAPIDGVLDDGGFYAMLGLNWLMLAFGFALEVSRAVPPLAGLALGGASFVGAFAFLGRFVDDGDALSVGLYAAIYGVWALYGVAAALDDVPKNVAYNALDVVSKNFYGVFLFAYALALA
jgi:hypothetical protein